LGDDEDLEPDNSRTALLLAPGKKPSVLDVAIVAAQQVRKLSGISTAALGQQTILLTGRRPSGRAKPFSET
jgi:hypothetical protein